MKKLPVRVPQTLRDSLFDFILQHKMSCKYRENEIESNLNPVSCPLDGCLLDSTNTTILVTDAGRGALGCLAIVSKNGVFNFIKSYPEVLTKAEREKHSTKREINAGLHYLRKLKPTLIKNKTKTLNWLTDSTATTYILTGVITHDDPEVMELMTSLRALCIELGIKINVIWRRRNSPLLQYADLMTKLVPTEGDETGFSLRSEIRKFLHFAQKSQWKLKQPQNKKLYSVLGAGKLLEATSGPFNILVFPFSSTICEEIFRTLGSFPRKKMLIVPAFPSSSYWKYLNSSQLTMAWVGLLSELFPSSPLRCKASIWY